MLLLKVLSLPVPAGLLDTVGATCSFHQYVEIHAFPNDSEIREPKHSKVDENECISIFRLHTIRQVLLHDTVYICKKLGSNNYDGSYRQVKKQVREENRIMTCKR